MSEEKDKEEREFDKEEDKAEESLIKLFQNLSPEQYELEKQKANRDFYSLTDKQRRFVEQYLKTGNASEAARLAGYAKNNAKVIAYGLLKKPIVARIVEVRRRELAEMFGLSKEKLVCELQTIKDRSILEGKDIRAIKIIELQAKMLGYFSDSPVNNVNVDATVNITLGGKRFTEERDFESLKNDADDTKFEELKEDDINDEDFNDELPF